MIFHHTMNTRKFCACDRRLDGDLYKCMGCEVQYCSSRCAEMYSNKHALVCHPDVAMRMSRALCLFAGDQYLHTQRRTISHTIALYPRAKSQPQVLLIHNYNDLCLICLQKCSESLRSKLYIGNESVDIVTCARCIVHDIRLCTQSYLSSNICKQAHDKLSIQRMMLLHVYIGDICNDIYILIASEMIRHGIHHCTIDRPEDSSDDD